MTNNTIISDQSYQHDSLRTNITERNSDFSVIIYRQEQRTNNLNQGLAAILAGHTRPEGANMKTATTALLGMFAVCGLFLAGSETGNFIVQVLLSTGGVMLFGAALLAITFVQGGE